MGASGAKYGITTCHFYWVGAIPAMVFLGVFMMPFYYGSKARSVPEYLKLRFNEKTRGFNAFSFAVMTIFASGISMFAMAKLMQILLGWDFNFSLVISAIIVLVYTFLGGLTSAIYNEVLQFFLIVAGFVPLVFLGAQGRGRMGAACRSVCTSCAQQAGLPPMHGPRSWAHMGSPSTNPMGVEWFGLVMGLGFVLSFGYWCTNFLVVQRAMAAKSMSAARNTPLIGAIPKMFIPILVILPGMIAIALTSQQRHQRFLHYQDADGKLGLQQHDSRSCSATTCRPACSASGLPRSWPRSCPAWPGNVTAFNTVWTYDIYQSYIQAGPVG